VVLDFGQSEGVRFGGNDMNQYALVQSHSEKCKSLVNHITTYVRYVQYAFRDAKAITTGMCTRMLDDNAYYTGVSVSDIRMLRCGRR